MKNTMFIIICYSFLFSCSVGDNNTVIKQKIILNESSREVIDGLLLPTVNLKLLKDGEEYFNEVDLPLISVGGTYTINLELITGSTYLFEEFTIMSDGKMEYILDENNLGNTEGFSLSIDGVLSTTPKVYLTRVTGIIFENLEYETLSIDVSTDESSYLAPISLTFEISSNILDATFHVYKYTIYWVSGPELNQNEIYDMDTGNLFDPLIEGDDDPWGSGKFKIVTINSKGESVFVVGFSDEWSKKHIHLILD